MFLFLSKLFVSHRLRRINVRKYCQKAHHVLIILIVIYAFIQVGFIKSGGFIRFFFILFVGALLDNINDISPQTSYQTDENSVYTYHC